MSGSLAANKAKLSGSSAPLTDVALGAMLDLGIASCDVVSLVPPVTISLSIEMLHWAPGADPNLDTGDWTHALQVGVPYTIGLTVDDGDGRSITAFEAFTIPSDFEPPKPAANARPAQRQPSLAMASPASTDTPRSAISAASFVTR